MPEDLKSREEEKIVIDDLFESSPEDESGDNLPAPGADTLPEGGAKGAGATGGGEEPAGGEAPSFIDSVPEKFRTPDGKVNIGALAKSYTEAEKKLRALEAELSKLRTSFPSQQQPQTLATSQPQAPQADDGKVRELAEAVVEKLLADPVEGLQQMAQMLAPLVTQQVVPQTTQMIYQMMPPDERLKRVVVSSIDQLEPTTKEKLLSNVDRYEKGFDMLLQRLGPETIEAQMAGYAMAGKPPAQFIIDMVDALELQAQEQARQIREGEKANVPPVKGSGTVPETSKREPTVEELAKAIINEESDVLDF